MIDTKVGNSIVGNISEQALDAARTSNQEQLLSITRQIDSVDIFHIYERWQGKSDARTFWLGHDREVEFAALGSCKELVATDDRFETIKFAWTKLSEEAWVDNPYNHDGTGLSAFGGFAFDPAKKASGKWSYFPAGMFVLPAFLIARHGEEYFATMNMFVTEHDDQKRVMQKWESLSKLFHKAETGSPELRIRSMEEQDTESWIKTVCKAKADIQAGQADKIVLARELMIELEEPADAGQIVNQLILQQQNSYIFSFQKGDSCFVGATPERLVRVSEGEVLSTCLAGTAPRGTNAVQDELIAKELLEDDKNRSEHQFVVKMISDVLKKYCSFVDIPEEPRVQRLKNLQHLYTPVTARLNEHAHLLDIAGELHPTPALGGTPKQKAMEFIREHELLDRGWYGAPVGWMDDRGNGEFAVAIRSGLLKGDQISLFAGCGIVADSDPQTEYEETKMKFRPMLQALEVE